MLSSLCLTHPPASSSVLEVSSLESSEELLAPLSEALSPLSSSSSSRWRFFPMIQTLQSARQYRSAAVGSFIE
jgi:hypothetical protein